MTFQKGHKGFPKFGTDNPASKFHPRKVAEIRRLVRSGLKYPVIAQRVKCSLSYVSLVARGKRRAKK